MTTGAIIGGLFDNAVWLLFALFCWWQAWLNPPAIRDARWKRAFLVIGGAFLLVVAIGNIHESLSKPPIAAPPTSPPSRTPAGR